MILQSPRTEATLSERTGGRGSHYRIVRFTLGTLYLDLVSVKTKSQVFFRLPIERDNFFWGFVEKPEPYREGKPEV